MKKMISNLNNEEGSVIIMALIILVALTMIGIVSTDNTVVELQIVRNEAIYRQNFYRAESAVIEGAQLMKDSILTVPPTIPWIQMIGTAPDMEDVSNWNVVNSNLSNNVNPSDANNNTRYGAIFIKREGSKKATNTTGLLSYYVYGLFDSTAGQGRSMIRMGYYKRQ